MATKLLIFVFSPKIGHPKNGLAAWGSRLPGFRLSSHVAYFQHRPSIFIGHPWSSANWMREILQERSYICLYVHTQMKQIHTNTHMYVKMYANIYIYIYMCNIHTYTRLIHIAQKGVPQDFPKTKGQEHSLLRCKELLEALSKKVHLRPQKWGRGLFSDLGWKVPELDATWCNAVEELGSEIRVFFFP